MSDDIPDASEQSYPIGDRVRIFRRGAIWYANYQMNGRQHRVSLKTTSLKEARRKAGRIEADLDSGRWSEMKVVATVGEAIAAYRDFLQAEGRSPKTHAKYNKVFEYINDLALAKKVKNLAGIDLKFVDAYRRQRTDDGVKSKTIYTECVILRQLVNFALSRDMVSLDPLKGIKLRKPRPTRQPCWKLDQLQTILATSPAEIRPALTLLAETGMRFGEMAWLTWADVDLKTNVLHIREKEGWRPKSGDQRVVPLTGTLQQLVKSLPKAWRWVVTMPPSARHPLPGRQWTERRLLSTLKRVLKRLDLPGKLHTFRHTFISNALLQGIPTAVVREWVGHVDPEVIKLYTHVHDEASQEAMRRLAEANQSQRTGPLASNEDGTRSTQNQHTPKEQ